MYVSFCPKLYTSWGGDEKIRFILLSFTLFAIYVQISRILANRYGIAHLRKWLATMLSIFEMVYATWTFSPFMFLVVPKVESSSGQGVALTFKSLALCLRICFVLFLIVGTRWSAVSHWNPTTTFFSCNCITSCLLKLNHNTEGRWYHGLFPQDDSVEVSTLAYVSL